MRIHVASNIKVVCRHNCLSACLNDDADQIEQRDGSDGPKKLIKMDSGTSDDTSEARASLAQQLRVFRQTADGPQTEVARVFPTVKRKKLGPFKCPFLCLASPHDQVIPSRATQV